MSLNSGNDEFSSDDDCMHISDSDYIPDSISESGSSSEHETLGSNNKKMSNQFVNPDFVDELLIKDEISIEENKSLECISINREENLQAQKAIDASLPSINNESVSKNYFLRFKNSEVEHFPSVKEIKSEPGVQTGNDTQEASNYLRVALHHQSSTLQSDAEQNHAAKYLKIEVTPEVNTAKTQSFTKQTKTEGYKKLRVFHQISLLPLPSSTQHIQNAKDFVSETAPHLITSDSEAKIEQTLQRNVETKPINALQAVVSQIPQNNSLHPVLLERANTTLVKNEESEPISENNKIDPNSVTEIQKVRKKKMQKKWKKKLMKIARKDSEKIKYSTLLKLKKMAKKDVIYWLINLGVITSRYQCPKCGMTMKLTRRSKSLDGYVWKCNTQVKEFNVKCHSISRSARVGSIFQGSNLSIEDILILIHCWIYKIPSEWMCLELSSCINTITLCTQICQDICTEVCAKDGVKIGGYEKVVEISGKVFEKHSYEKIQFQWIFFGLEDAYTHKYFFRIVDKCDKQSFLQTVKSAVLPGTKIVSEFCSDFSDPLLDDSNEYSSYTFESLEESSSEKKSWDYILKQFPNKHDRTNNFDSCIGEYVWRKRNSTARDKMKKFLSDIRMLYPLPVKD